MTDLGLGRSPTAITSVNLQARRLPPLAPKMATGRPAAIIEQLNQHRDAPIHRRPRLRVCD